MTRLFILVASAAGVALVSVCGSNTSGNPNTGQPSSSQPLTKPGSATARPSSSSTGTARPGSLPINGSGVLAGNAKPRFPMGDPGKVDVVQIGELSKDAGGATLPVVIRNNTDKGVAHVDLSAVAHGSSGKVVATGSSPGFEPAQIQPGEPALGFIYLEADKALPPAGAAYTFTADVERADKSPYNTARVKIDEANYTGQAIVGTGSNKTGAKLTGPYSVNAYCFDTASKLVATYGTYAEPNSDLVPGAQISFTIDLYRARCQNYLVGSSGYFG
jgi:hypothetical protein